MIDPDKGFSCSACQEHANKYCFKHMMKVKTWNLCPDFNPIWEDV